MSREEEMMTGWPLYGTSRLLLSPILLLRIVWDNDYLDNDKLVEDATVDD